MNKKNRIVLFALFLIFFLISIICICKVVSYPIDAVSEKHTLQNSNAAKGYIDKVLKNNIYYGHYDDAAFTWESEIWSKNNFRYYNAFVMLALLKTGFSYNLANSFYNDIFTDDGKVNRKNNKENYFISGEVDTIFMYYPLYYLPKQKKYVFAIEKAYKSLLKQDVLTNCGGNYIHKLHDKNWEIYKFSLDGVYMALPFLLKHDGNEEEVFKRIDWINKNMRLENGLYSHGIKQDCTNNEVVWLRGTGWYAMAQIEILNLLKNRKYRHELKKQLSELFDAMINYQDYKTGMWRNVVHPKVNKCNYFESSGTLMMAYSMLEAYEKGYVKDKKYLNAGLRAYNGVMDYNFNKDKGVLNNIYLMSNVKKIPNQYCNCDMYINDEAKGLAPLILATDVVNKLLKNK